MIMRWIMSISTWTTGKLYNIRQVNTWNNKTTTTTQKTKSKVVFNNIESQVFLRPLPFIALIKCICVWKHPKHMNNAIRHLLCCVFMMITAACQYKSWSNVTILERLCFTERLHTKYNVDKMHVMYQQYILIIGLNLTYNCPGCWHNSHAMKST